MPHKLFAIRYNDRHCLLHLKYDEQRMVITFLSKEMAKDMGVERFEVSSKGELLTPAIAKTDKIDLEALKELYTSLVAANNNRTIRNYDERVSAA